MSVVAKSTLMAVKKHAQTRGETLLFYPNYDDTIEEDKRFAKATPSGELQMLVDNPAALAFFELGQQYYLHFEKA